MWTLATTTINFDNVQLEAARAITGLVRSTQGEIVLAESQLSRILTRLKTISLLKGDEWSHYPPADDRRQTLVIACRQRFKRNDWRNTQFLRPSHLGLNPIALTPLHSPLLSSFQFLHGTNLLQSQQSSHQLTRSIHSDSFQAERTAPREAIKWLSSISSWFSAIIIRDCKSLVHPVSNANSAESSVSQEQAAAVVLAMSISIMTLWSPGLCGQPGNELADH